MVQRPNSSTKSSALAANAAGKQRGKPFERGQSGNPNGKAKGTRNKTTELVEKLLKGEAEKVTRSVLEAAAAGDMRAATIVLERIAPVRRGRPVAFPLPALESADDVGKAFSAIVAAMARGESTPDEAGAVAAVIELRRKAIETSELEKRIAALEKSKETTP